jgi:hypothetical protein
VIRSLMFAFVTIAAVMAMSTAYAQAKLEFCPARISYWPASPAAGGGGSTGLVYALDANSPRTILSAKIIADTDGGWYSWDVSKVPVTPQGTAGDEESARRVAVFDKAVFVRHAWILQARTSGDTVYGWDAEGEVACGIPHFAHAEFSPQTPQNAQDLPRDPTTPIAPPYDVHCAHPFAEARVVRAAQPVYPHFVPRMWYTAQIEVAIGDGDQLLDAWTYKSSGYKAIDLSALAAARASSYESATSYCQKADGFYIFRADFEPN